MADLLLDSLEIKNFRAFKHLRIEKLGRVNLIVGKNNVGKTSVLEALRLYAERGSHILVWELIEERDESNQLQRLSSPQTGEQVILNLRHLFHGRQDIRHQQNSIQIGSLSNQNNTMNIDIVWRDREELYDEYEEMITVRTPSILFKKGGIPIYGYSLEEIPSRILMQSIQSSQISSYFVSSDGLDPFDATHLWDQIVLTDLEEEIVRALKLISPNIERLNFIASGDDTRIPVVRLTYEATPIPLRSMGEGMNRMLGIALSLVNARDGFLLIDEIESGLHYSVQADMWRLIFETAHRLNVQVFATTHSLDCIRTFQYAASENRSEEGVLIRLVQRDDDIIATTFDEEDLAVITRDEIEVR